MASLVDAIRASGNQTASYRTRDGTTVTVERITGLALPDNQDEYVVCVGAAGGPRRPEIAALDLVEAFERMRTLGLPGFDPDQAGWEPASSRSW
jgi:hypothetical protein